MRGRVDWIVVAALAFAVTAGAASAAARPDARAGWVLAQREDLISRERAARIAHERTGGRVLRVELRDGERPWYRVRVLVDDDRVKSVAVDARTGRLRR